MISKPGEVDYYRFTAKKGQTFDVHCFARRLGSPLDSVMTLGVVGGGALASNDDAVGPDSYFRFTFPEDKEYYLSVTDHLNQGGPTYFYRVEFLPVEAASRGDAFPRSGPVFAGAPRPSPCRAATAWRRW